MIALHTSIAIVAIIFLIIKVKVDPIVALVLGALYLGLASGVGFVETVEAITGGFGDIMAKIGLLIGFGVLMGALLHRMGAFTVMVEALVRVVPAQKLPYALALALTTIAPSIYVDVQVVLAAPVARSSSRLINKDGRRMISIGFVHGTEQQQFVIDPRLLDEGYVIVDVSREPLDGDPKHSGDSIVRGTLPI